MNRSSFFPIMILLLFGCAQGNDQDPIKKAFFGGEYEKTIALTKQKLETNADDPEALTFYGQSLVKLQRFEEAIPKLNRAVDLDKTFPARMAWGLLSRGEAYYCLGNYLQAKADLDEITRIQSRALGQANFKLAAYGLLPSFESWKLIETQNIRFHFQSESTITDVNAWAELRQKAFDTINRYFGVTLPKKIDFFVWNSNEDARKVVHRTLGFAMDKECVVHSRTNQTRGHELTHVITGHVSPEQYRNRLINEGFAVCFDQSRKNKFEFIARYLKTKGNKGKIDITEIWKSAKHFPDEIVYPLGGILMEQIIKTSAKDEVCKFLENQSRENADAIFGKAKMEKIIRDLEAQINGHEK